MLTIQLRYFLFRIRISVLLIVNGIGSIMRHHIRAKSVFASKSVEIRGDGVVFIAECIA